MAVARMLKASLIAYEPQIDQLVEALQFAGALQIEVTEIDGLSRALTDSDMARLRELDGQIAHAAFVVDFLSRYRKSTAKFSAFISEKFHLSESEYRALAPDDDFDSVYRECEDISDKLASLERERARLEQVVHDLRPWRALRLEISRWRGTEHVALFTGTVPPLRSEEIRQMLREAVREMSVQEVGPAGDREAWVVMAHKCVLSEVRATLALTEFCEVSFPDLSGFPADELEVTEERLGRIALEHDELAERAKGLAPHYAKAFALRHALLSRRDAIEVKEQMASSERAVVMRGWVPEARVPELTEALEPISANVDFGVTPPSPDDDPPVELDNPWWLRPFEVLTDLYGRPRYGDLDPTPLLAGFFFLFFGMCIGDAGYGLVLMVAAWYIKRHLDVAAGVRRFMDLLIAGGISSIIVGILTRSYFALTAEQLPEFMRYKPLFDLPQEILNLLIFSIVLGVIHVLFGVGINMYRLARAGDYESLVLDDGSTLLFLASVAAAVVFGEHALPIIVSGITVATIAKGRVHSAPMKPQAAAWDRGLGWAWAIFAILFVELAAFGLGSGLAWPFVAATTVGIAASKGVRATVVGALSGLYELYGMTGYLSDFLSYSRLAALGLASLLVGNVMNILATLVGSAGAIWWIAGALILIVGHTFNVVINLLGAFVHPTRLQFVEFFSKFYEGGGENFSPFAVRAQSVVLHPDQGGQEGGSFRD